MLSEKIFTGLAMVIMNYGSRYVVSDITKYHEHVMQSIIAKKIILFCMCFVATREVMPSIILTFGITLIIDFLMNEKSRFSILPYSVKKHFLVHK
jgi:hypothetical protein